MRPRRPPDPGASARRRTRADPRARSDRRRAASRSRGRHSVAPTQPASPMDRGRSPNGTPAHRRNVRWKTPIPGLATSSPIVWGDRVIVVDGRERRGQLVPHRLVRRRQARRRPCPSTATASTRSTAPPGKIVWNATCARDADHPSATPSRAMPMRRRSPTAGTSSPSSDRSA